jgi:hypothetical protein
LIAQWLEKRFLKKPVLDGDDPKAQ